jgi:hypothetical protein
MTASLVSELMVRNELCAASESASRVMAWRMCSTLFPDNFDLLGPGDWEMCDTSSADRLCCILREMYPEASVTVSGRVVQVRMKFFGADHRVISEESSRHMFGTRLSDALRCQDEQRLVIAHVMGGMVSSAKPGAPSSVVRVPCEDQFIDWDPLGKYYIRPGRTVNHKGRDFVVTDSELINGMPQLQPADGGTPVAATQVYGIAGRHADFYPVSTNALVVSPSLAMFKMCIEGMPYLSLSHDDIQRLRDWDISRIPFCLPSRVTGSVALGYNTLNMYSAMTAEQAAPEAARPAPDGP